MQAAKLPPLNLRDVPLEVLVNRLNALIQEQNHTSPKTALPRLILALPSRDADLGAANVSSRIRVRHDLITLRLDSEPVAKVLWYTAALTNLVVVPEPSSIELIPSSTSLQELTTRHYLVPTSVFAGGDAVKSALRKWGVLNDTAAPGEMVDFDPKSRVLTLKLGGDQIDAFELLYAHELLKHGFSAPPG